MKPYKYVAAVALFCLTAACEVKTSGGGGLTPPATNEKPWPAYADQVLSGKVFGKDWKAVAATLRPFTGDASKVSVQFYNTNSPDICKNGYTSTGAYASMVIPANYSEQEIVSDLSTGEGNPLVFSTFEGGAQNTIADKSKMRISNKTDNGFLASVYASGTNEDASLSEINGKITVTDCRKVADFSVWQELSGWYDLQTFNGQTVKARYASVELKTNSFFDRAQNKYVRAYQFPLFTSVSENSDVRMDFGPLEGLGTSSVQESGGVKTYKYSYNGPINYRNTDITLILDLTATKATSGMVTVSYTLEVPKYIQKTSNTFTMK